MAIELLEFNLRGGEEAPLAATRVARITERYLSTAGARDTMAVVSEIVGWLGSGDPVPHTLRLELAVTSGVVRISVTAAERHARTPALASSESLREALPVTAALASRYGVEARRRTRVWAEFDRLESPALAHEESEYS